MANVGLEPEPVELRMFSALDEDGKKGEPGNPETPSSCLLILEESGSSPASSAIAPVLEARGYQLQTVHSHGEALQALGRWHPGVLILAAGREHPGRLGGGSAGELRAAARRQGIAVLDVLDANSDLDAFPAHSEENSDWVLRGSPPNELAARVARLLRGRKPVPSTAAVGPIDSRFTALVVHDLRSPLNVIGLSLRMIEPALPMDDPEVVEDLRFIDENFRQLERMLAQLGDYSRLFEVGLKMSVSAFNPSRLIDELLENRDTRPGRKPPTVRLDVQRTCPLEAELDQVKARVAIDYALANASAAAQDAPIRVVLRGTPERWIIEVVIDRPPPSSVRSTTLRPLSFERLCGSAAERRGMDLSIAARVSELFGGTARLEVVDGRCSSIILDWPARISGSATNP